MEEIIDSFKRLAASNKFKVLVVAVATALSQDTVPGISKMSPDTVKAIIFACSVWMGAQGLTDIGKEKAKIEKVLSSESTKQ